MSDVNNFVGTTIGQTLSYAFKQFPTVLKAAAIPTVLYMGMVFYLLMPGLLDSMGQLILLEESDDPALVFSALGGFIGPVLLATIFGVLYYAVVFAPILRNIIYNEPVGLFRVDGTVFRLAVAMVIIYGILIATMIVAMIPTTILAVLAESSGNQALTGFASILMIFALYGAIFFVMIRTSLIIPDVASSGRLRISNGWKASKGHFWTLFVVYLVAYIIAMLITYAGMIVAFIVGGIGVATNPAFTDLDPETIDLSFISDMVSTFSTSPLGILAFIIYGITSIFAMGAFAAMMGFAYKNLTETADSSHLSDI